MWARNMPTEAVVRVATTRPVGVAAEATLEACRIEIAAVAH
jgi:hypothetical protein